MKAIKSKYRPVLTIALLIAVLVAFAYYLSNHREVVTQLKTTPPGILLGLLGLYIGWFVCLAGIMYASLRICRRSLTLRDNFLLNAYSTLANFFVPGQSGIAVRGIYLKRLHDLKIRNYIYTSLLYYACYAIISIGLLLGDNRPLWQTLIALLVVTTGCYVIIFLYRKRSKIDPRELNLHPKNISLLIGACAAQAAIQTTIYAVELHRVSPLTHLSQVITYTGAANFALFVALTPGAIGVRESFLVFTHRLHHISDASIVSANVIDRSVFIVFLGLLFLLTLGFKAQLRVIRSLAKKESEQQASKQAA
jgi:uncharacterized membrane protein YbhN (UPF0104 family)